MLRFEYAKLHIQLLDGGERLTGLKEYSLACTNSLSDLLACASFLTRSAGRRGESFFFFFFFVPRIVRKDAHANIMTDVTNLHHVDTPSIQCFVRHTVYSLYNLL